MYALEAKEKFLRSFVEGTKERSLLSYILLSAFLFWNHYMVLSTFSM